MPLYFGSEPTKLYFKGGMGELEGGCHLGEKGVWMVPTLNFLTLK